VFVGLTYLSRWLEDQPERQPQSARPGGPEPKRA
jgi:hypothetical protein